ncbi:MAG: acyltransferase [Patescibacteria group bacterium]|nr:acyltransferase [bacterium]MDZ4240717.1 acyltransferase [Patescibacteria group bacterium]
MEKFDTSTLKSVGKDVFISPLVSIVRPELVVLGNHISIDPWFHCTTALEIGDHVHIQAQVGIIGGKTGILKMGNFTNISIKGTIICVSEKFYGKGLIATPGIPEKFLDEYKTGPVIFEDFVNTGANVTVLPGITLAEGSVIGACSLVTKNTEPWTIYAGIPARPIGTIGNRPKEKMLQYAKEMGYR